MTDRSGQRELVFCHACENEWPKDRGGLECPQCHSDCVEVIEQGNDPRDSHIDLTSDGDDDEMPRLTHATPHPPLHPLHNHDPWANDAPDPDEGDIEHVAFNPAPGIHFQRTTFRSTSPPGQNPGEAFGPLFQSFAGIFNPGAPPPGFHPPPNSFPPMGHQHTHIHNHPPGFPPNQQPQIRTNVRVFGAGDQNLNNLHAVMQNMLATLSENAVRARDPHTQHPGQPEGNPFDLLMQTLTQFRDPARAAHGDAVFTDEAMDRIISQMMEQQGSAGSAPGPATAAAIANLPKKKADKKMVGMDGKGECSICMDAVHLENEVTVLPCEHWFHGDCVGAWLKEHDTCPHCRQGIMPKDATADATTPRSPGQTPRHAQTWGSSLSEDHGAAPRFAQPPPRPSQGTRPQMPPMPTMPGAFTQPGMQHQYMPGGYPGYPEPRDFVQPQMQQGGPSRTPRSMSGQEERRESRSSRSSGSGNGEGSSNGSPGSRVAGWWRNLRGGSGSGEQR